MSFVTHMWFMAAGIVAIFIGGCAVACRIDFQSRRSLVFYSVALGVLAGLFVLGMILSLPVDEIAVRRTLQHF